MTEENNSGTVQVRSTSDSSSMSWKSQFWVTVGLLACFAIFVGFMMFNAKGATEAEWSRWVYLFMGVEAIVFTSVGWLFGREVNRTAVESATAQADAATQEAKEKIEDAAVERTKGQTVKAYALKEAQQQRPAGYQDAAEDAGLDGGSAYAGRSATSAGMRNLVLSLWPD